MASPRSGETEAGVCVCVRKHSNQCLVEAGQESLGPRVALTTAPFLNEELLPQVWEHRTFVEVSQTCKPAKQGNCGNSKISHYPPA